MTISFQTALFSPAQHLKILMHLNMNLIVCRLLTVNDINTHKRPSFKLYIFLLYPFKVIYGVRNNEMLGIAEVISFSLPFRPLENEFWSRKVNDSEIQCDKMKINRQDEDEKSKKKS